jgi:hypothetical protein
MRELALPLIEQRSVAQREVSLQVLLPHARIDVHAGRRELARELAAYEICDADAARAFFEAADLRGDELRARLLEGEPAEASGGAFVQRMFARAARSAPQDAGLGPVPPGLAPIADALVAGLSRLVPDGAAGRDAALLLRSTREGGFFMPDAGSPFLDLFRRRLALQGDPLDLGLRAGERAGRPRRRAPRGRLFARAVVLAAPLELIRRSRASRVPCRAGSPRARLPST